MTLVSRRVSCMRARFQLALVLILVFGPKTWGQNDPRPNIVIITADNLGYGDVGCYGNQLIRTPNIDRLAIEGVRCTDFYTASPTCSVSRACLLTGRYPQRHGLVNQLPGIEGNYGVGLRQTEILIPQVLQLVGYKTACFGKWNIGFAPGSRPTERGFDEFFGHASGNIDYFTHVYLGKPDMHRGIESVSVPGYCTELFAEAACDFIRRHTRQPFFMYLPFNAPHYPSSRNKKPGEAAVWEAPARYFELYGYRPDEPDEKQRYRVVVTAMDVGLGRVLKQLDESGLTRSTLVIFFSDNGAFMLKDRGLEVASNKPLRDGGVTLYEGGIRVPCVVRWPGRIRAGSICREPLISMDFFVMSQKAARAPLPHERVIDGRDPTATLAGEIGSPHREFYYQFRKYSAMRRGRYKLIRPTPDKSFELYDLREDAGESDDLAVDKPRLTAELQAAFEKWLGQFEL